MGDKQLVQTVDASGDILCDETFVGVSGLSLSAMCDIHSSGGGGGKGDNDDGNKTMLIIIIVSSVAVVLFIVCLLTVYCMCSKKRSAEKYEKFIGNDPEEQTVNN